MKNYDPGCLRLTEMFVCDLPDLSDDDRAALADELAQTIQSELERHIEYRMAPCEFCGAPRARGSHENCVLF